jgi:hypothetical protein
LFSSKKSKTPPEGNNNKPKPFPRMSHINKALCHSDVKDIVWTTLGFDKHSLVLPRFKNDILYGRLSEMLHAPKFPSVFISDKEDLEHKEFFRIVVEHYDLVIKEYSEEEAAAGEEAMGKDDEDEDEEPKLSIMTGRER